MVGTLLIIVKQQRLLCLSLAPAAQVSQAAGLVPAEEREAPEKDHKEFTKEDLRAQLV